MDKLQYLNDLTALIGNNLIKEVVETEIKLLPEGFFTKPASSSGHHHPLISRGERGLINHTRLAFNALNVLLQATPGFDEISKDFMMGAILLHDGKKYGDDGLEERTLSDHDDLMADYLLEKSEKQTDRDYKLIYSELSRLIRTHHGIWSLDLQCRNLQR